MPTRRVLGGYSSDDPTLDPTTYDQPQAPRPGPGTPTTPGDDSTQGPTITAPKSPSQPGPGTPTTPTPTPAPTSDVDFLAKPGIANGAQWGGGWDQPWASPLSHALEAEIGNGLSGQAAIDQIAKDYPSVANLTGQIQYYGDKGQYGLPGNMYVAPNKDKGGILDLILRPGQEGGGENAGLPDANLGGFDFNSLPNIGNDPLSKSTDAKLQELIDNNGQVKDTNGQIEALNLENARGMADRARKAEMAGVDSTLANRGLLDQYDPSGGQHANSANYVEQNDIAPMFSDAVRSYMINDNNNASQRLQSALGDVTTRQGVLSNIALQSLAQNTAFQEFAATYGLQKDQILEQLRTGNDSNLINLLELFLQRNGQLDTGFH